MIHVDACINNLIGNNKKSIWTEIKNIWKNEQNNFVCLIFITISFLKILVLRVEWFEVNWMDTFMWINDR